MVTITTTRFEFQQAQGDQPLTRPAPVDEL